MSVKVGDTLKAGEIYCTCPETKIITHKCMLSPMSKGGEVVWTAEDGEYTVNDVVCRIKIRLAERRSLPSVKNGL